MYRWHKDRQVMARRQKLWDSVNESFDLGNVRIRKFFPRKERTLGRFFKKKPFDCGRARCGICHWDKFPRRRLRDEQRSFLNTKEQIKELNEEDYCSRT
jgi:hypothetical protein